MPHPAIFVAGVVIFAGAGYIIYNELNKRSQEEEAYQTYVTAIKLEKKERAKRLNGAEKFDDDHLNQQYDKKCQDLQDQEEKLLSSSNSVKLPHIIHDSIDNHFNHSQSFSQSSSTLTKRSNQSSHLRQRSSIRNNLESDHQNIAHPPLIDLGQQFYPPLSISNRSRSTSTISSRSNFLTSHEEQRACPISSAPISGPVIFVAPNELLDPFDDTQALKTATTPTSLVDIQTNESKNEIISSNKLNESSFSTSSSSLLRGPSRDEPNSNSIDYPALIDFNLHDQQDRETERPNFVQKTSDVSLISGSEEDDNNKSTRHISLSGLERTEYFEEEVEELTRKGRIESNYEKNQPTKDKEDKSDRVSETLSSPSSSFLVQHQVNNSIGSNQLNDEHGQYPPQSFIVPSSINLDQSTSSDPLDENWSDLGSETFESI